jgi:hypothetical protein
MSDRLDDARLDEIELRRQQWRGESGRRRGVSDSIGWLLLSAIVLPIALILAGMAVMVWREVFD